jgi:hypothetical protein
MKKKFRKEEATPSLLSRATKLTSLPDSQIGKKCGPPFRQAQDAGHCSWLTVRTCDRKRANANYSPHAFSICSAAKRAVRGTCMELSYSSENWHSCLPFDNGLRGHLASALFSFGGIRASRIILKDANVAKHRMDRINVFKFGVKINAIVPSRVEEHGVLRLPRHGVRAMKQSLCTELRIAGT